MAHLIAALAISGACDNTGTPVASGRAWFFEPGSTFSQKTVYSDADGLSPLTQPVPLDAGGRATVYTNGAVRLQVESSAGTLVNLWDRANTCESPEVEVENAGYTGTVLSGNQAGSLAAGGRTNLGAVLTNLYASHGGVDGQYQILNAAGTRIGAPMSVTKAISSVAVNVKSFTTTSGLPVAGDGVQVDTTGLQAAVNYVVAAGGGTVYLPPGTYLIDQAILATNGTGVVLQGAGYGSTTIKNSNTLGNSLTLSGGSGITIRGLYMTTVSASAGVTISATTVTGLILDGVKIDGSATGLYLDHTNKALITGNSDITGSTVGITGTTVIRMVMLGSFASSVTTASFSNVEIVGSQVTLFTTDISSANIILIGNSISSLVFGGGSQPLGFYQYGNGIEGQSINVVTGATVGTIDLALGNDITINANSGGAGTVTVPAITNPPDASRRGYIITIRFKNAATGAVTWALNAVYVLDGAVAVPTTDLHTIVVQFLWDNVAAKWRELGRSNTLT